jgi:hypothetical protein
MIPIHFSTFAFILFIHHALILATDSSNQCITMEREKNKAAKRLTDEEPNDTREPLAKRMREGQSPAAADDEVMTSQRDSLAAQTYLKAYSKTQKDYTIDKF